MSRCFPYPPPGYEPRLRSEHRDLLKKESHKGKKHRKENDKEKGERKAKVREKGERKRKDGDHKKLKREKRGERRKNNNRDKQNHQTLEKETQKNADFDNRRPEERRQNEAVEDIKRADGSIAQLPGQKGHTNHKVNSTSELVPRSTKGFGATAYKEESSLSRMVKKSGHAIQHYHGMVQRNDSIAYTDKKGTVDGVGAKTRLKNGKRLQLDSGGKHSSRRHRGKVVDLLQDNSYTQSSEVVHATRAIVSDAGKEPNGRITPSPNTLQRAEEVQRNTVLSKTKGLTGKGNQISNNHHGNTDLQLEQSAYDAVEGDAKIEEAGVKSNYLKCVKGKDGDQGVNKRKSNSNNKVKEMEIDGDVNEQNKVDDLMHLTCLDEQFGSDDIKKRKDLNTDSSLHGHGMRTTKLPRTSPTNITCINGKITPHSMGVDWHKPQDNYSSGITASHYLEQQKVSVPSFGYDSNEGYIKPTHPDTKYLSQVHSVPPREDISEYIDQDWLFSQDCVKQKMATFEAAESHQVWCDAHMIDTADVVALPYVVPL